VRKALNENPVIQAAILGVLAIFVAFMLITRVLGGEESAAPTPPSSATSGSTPTTAAPPAGAATTTPAAPTTGAATTTPAAPTTESAAPATDVPATDATASGSPSPASLAPGQFVAGPGLPQKVVTAYAQGKAVALYIYRRKGVDDAYGRFNYLFVRLLRSENLEDEVTMFTTNAHHIARYSRIAEGVDVSRVPALVVISPRDLTNNEPVASVSYGYRGPESVVQAVEDALYKGREDVPYYPE
jgi:hypothetical protein